MRHLYALSTLLCALGIVTFAGEAGASEGTTRLRVDWSAFADTYRNLNSGTREAEPSQVRAVANQTSAWFGSGLMMSIVVRDWQGATHLAGGPMSVTDAIRTSRASRMMVARIGLGGGRIIPYIHVGAGQWREPNQRLRDAPVEVAGEAGAGFETRLSRSCAIGVEYNWTALYIEDHRSNNVAPQVNGVFAVARWEY